VHVFAPVYIVASIAIPFRMAGAFVAAIAAIPITCFGGRRSGE